MTPQIKVTLNLKSFTWGELKKAFDKAGVQNDTRISLIEVDPDSEWDTVLVLDDEVFVTNYSNM